MKQKIVEILKQLSRPEQELLFRVLKIESEWLWSDRPRVKENILKAVREVIK